MNFEPKPEPEPNPELKHEPEPEPEPDKSKAESKITPQDSGVFDGWMYEIAEKSKFEPNKPVTGIHGYIIKNIELKLDPILIFKLYFIFKTLQHTSNQNSKSKCFGLIYSYDCNF